MTKRDFELIARVIRNQNPGSVNQTLTAHLYELAENFAAELARVNPRFDRARFMKACGFEGEG